MKNTETIKKLNALFGSYRAEWLKGKIFDYFAEPSYFLALQDNRPCVLEGGRGTGKTTVLRGLSYEGQYALYGKDIDKFDNESNYIGIYHRVDTNHVRAFTGGGLSDEQWIKIFAHYFNLIVCRDILLFIKWHNRLKPDDTSFTSHECNLIAKSLHVKNSNDFPSLIEALDISMHEFQASINNINNDNIPLLSMAGDPIKLTTALTISLPQFANKMFFILLDEYENYTDYQQKVINSLIKHSSENYTFKVGVRELGWRIKHTLNEFELLHDPADYVLINIENKLTEESHFVDFARNVCQQRIEQLFTNDTTGFKYDIQNALSDLTIEEEAEILGVENTEYWKEIKYLPQDINKVIQNLPKLYIFFLAYWGKLHNINLHDIIEDYKKDIHSWDVRYDNYKYEMLFKIKKGRGRSGIQKYYSGWNTFTKLASGNIRYLMELVYRTYEKHLSKEDVTQSVHPKVQTEAAQDIGKKNLMELEGLWERGAHLTKILLGLGRIFQILARDEGKHAPEINQFAVENSQSISDKTRELLAAAVMNLALTRSPGNKLDKTNTRDYLYSIHPIFAPYFVFSYRKKRKMDITEEDIWGLINKPKPSIKKILEERNVIDVDDSELPKQLDLFEEFYNAES